MVRKFKGKFSKGKIEPLEPLNLREGQEVTITLGEEEGPLAAGDVLARSAGAWKGTLDFDKYLKDLYSARHDPGQGVDL